MRLNEFVEQCIEDYRRRVYGATAPLSEDEMRWRPDAEANSIAFIVWHAARVEDRLIQRFARGVQEVWKRDGWHARMGLPIDHHGVNYTLEQLDAFPPIAKDALKAYIDAVREETLAYLRGLDDGDFDAVIEGRVPFPESAASARYFQGWDVGRVFRQLIGEQDQHLGQVAYIRGLKRGFGK